MIALNGSLSSETQLTKRQKSNILHLEQIFGVKAVVHMLYYFCQLVHKKENLVFKHLTIFVPLTKTWYSNK